MKLLTLQVGVIVVLCVRFDVTFRFFCVCRFFLSLGVGTVGVGRRDLLLGWVVVEFFDWLLLLSNQPFDVLFHDFFFGQRITAFLVDLLILNLLFHFL